MVDPTHVIHFSLSFMAVYISWLGWRFLRCAQEIEMSIRGIQVELNSIDNELRQFRKEWK